MIKAAEAMALSDAVVRESNEKRLARYEENFNSFIANMISLIFSLNATSSNALVIFLFEYIYKSINRITQFIFFYR